MRLIARSKALVELRRIKDELRAHIGDRYEHRAKSCATCETPGACCLDAHFVNVRISRLEAAAIGRLIDEMDSAARQRVTARIDATEMDGDHFACPLFERGVGCLVHEQAKPLPCIAHACYERQEDLPPDHLLTEQEGLVDDLNVRAYGLSQPWLPIPVAIMRERQSSPR